MKYCMIKNLSFLSNFIKFYRFFDKKTGGGAAKLANKSAIKNENISIEELGEELHKPIIRQFKKREIY